MCGSTRKSSIFTQRWFAACNCGCKVNVQFTFFLEPVRACKFLYLRMQFVYLFFSVLNMADTVNLEMWTVVDVNGTPGGKSEPGKDFKATKTPSFSLEAFIGGLKALLILTAQRILNNAVTN